MCGVRCTHFPIVISKQYDMDQSPKLRTPNPGFNPGFTPLFYITNAGGELQVKLRVWCPEMWAQERWCYALNTCKLNKRELCKRTHNEVSVQI
jgi:hypothetical protein